VCFTSQLDVNALVMERLMPQNPDAAPEAEGADKEQAGTEHQQH
jgi:hypothetical protein